MKRDTKSLVRLANTQLASLSCRWTLTTRSQQMGEDEDEVDGVVGIRSAGIIGSSCQSPKRGMAHSSVLPVEFRKAATSAPFAMF